MKKKIIGIIASSLGVVLVSALLAAGFLMILRNKNVEETGNVLGISWYKEDVKEFEISTAEQLNEFAKLSNFYTFEKQKVKVAKLYEKVSNTRTDYLHKVSLDLLRKYDIIFCED